MPFRTIMALIIALVVAIIIGAFQILGLTVEQIQLILNSGDVTGQLEIWGALLFGQLIFPYTFATGGAYGPLVALGVAGFIAGLVSKSGVRMLFASLIAMGLFFLGYTVLSLGLDPSSVELLADIARNIAIDLGVAFALLFVPGIIGARLTADKY
ncbi:MAG: hypothetical protein GF309_09010 [Candidatus Lokiarchaeota archaeon]|nr:hypothetical protein [Candidatus Lokiarchaeota archaeon]